MRRYPLDYPKPSEVTLCYVVVFVSFIVGGIALAPTFLVPSVAHSPAFTVLVLVGPVAFVLGLVALYVYSTTGEPFVRFQEQIETLLSEKYGLEASGTDLWRMSLRRNLSTVPNVGPSNAFRGYWANFKLAGGSKVKLVLDIEADGSAQVLRKVGIFTYVPFEN